MRRKRSLASVLFELAAVLLMTALAFAWGKQTALAERGYNAIGGEVPSPAPPRHVLHRQADDPGLDCRPPGAEERTVLRDGRKH